ncbi:hypothetical protein [Actinoallomurus iriomotensis]|uniref:Calpain catalytic domain-containing protein n=1 Tax=Actinoallomurus iriomotensis TaxID=478107 RepID=A0A9W6REG2_9ACTN|nr:hypothetical protein [Actinoallomurus iriomotensis]GLY74099.1 hypothetical protein Airi01_023660 [Actinoallomurus iriomotensis]
MPVDRIGDSTDDSVETDIEQRGEDRRPPPDRPGAEGYPSRAESRAAAAAANKDVTQNSDQAPIRDEADSASAGDTIEPSDPADKHDDAGEAQSEADGAATEVDSPSTGETETDSPALAESRAERRIEDGGFTAISGEGVSDDTACAADLTDPAVERSLLDRLKQAAAKLDRSDSPQEISGIVDRPDFQDPGEHPDTVPDRYGQPLDRSDGTRRPLFDGDPSREQTKQGRLQDCGIISVLGAVAGHRPEAIRNCVSETSDGNYEVQLHEAKFSASRLRYEPTGRTITLTVTPDLPVFNDEPTKPAFADSGDTEAAWCPVLEKAIAGSDRTWSDERRDKWEQRWRVQSGRDGAPSGYVRLHQGSNASERAELLTQLTGTPAKTWEFPTEYDRNGRSPGRQILEEFRNILADNKPILVGTRSKHRNEGELIKDLKDGHAYEVTKIDDSNRVHLRNPWNNFQPEPLTIKEFRENIRPSYSTLE